MMSGIPTWFKIFTVLFFVIGIAAFAYSVSKCGIGKTLLLNNGAFYAAATGMCDTDN